MKKLQLKSSCSALLRKTDKSFYREFLPVYSAVFAVMILIFYIYYSSKGYSLIRGGDSYTQHLKALTYYATYIREILSALFTEGRLVLPEWDFEIGMGSDILTTFSYYSLGDPFNILSFLCPVRFMHIYYQLALVVRYYCTGIAFSLLCFHTDNHKNTSGIIGGAIAYTFSSFAVYAGLKHPYFVNPMIFLPLVILGVERILKGKSVLLFTAMVAVATVSNFYFFYMIVIMTVIYVAVRLICLYGKRIADTLKVLIKIAASSVIGVLMGCSIFMPTVFAYLLDNRSTSYSNIPKFYDEGHFERLFLSFFRYGRASVWLAVCVSIIFLPCLVTLFTHRKKNTHLKLLYIISIIMMSFPILGSLMNGLSYVSHRWCFGYVLLICFIITKTWDDFISSKKEHLTVLLSVTIVLGVITFSLADINTQLIFAFSALAVAMLIIFLFNEGIFVVYEKNGEERVEANKKVLNTVCIILVVLTSISYNYYMIAEGHGDFISEFKKKSAFDSATYKSDSKVLKAAEGDDSFWRYTGRDLTTNSSFISGVKSTQYYWSLSNSNIADFRREMNMAENLLYSYKGFDDRTALNALAGVKYFYSEDKNNSSLPYGYEKISDAVSVNKFALPLGYTYSECITRRDFSSLESSVAKQEMMLNAVLVEDVSDTSLPVTEKVSTEKTLEYTINPLSDVTVNENSFTVKKKGGQIEFVFDSVPDSETYFCADTLIYTGTYDSRADFDLVTTDESGQTYSKSFFYYTPEKNFYSGRESFDVNLGYSESGIKSFTLTFSCPGTYTFENLSVIAQPFSSYEEAISKLKEDTLENVEIDYNRVSGNISLDESKFLCLSIPYSKGWTVAVDGEKADLVKANGMYMGVMLSEGEHEIILKYSTPYLKAGIATSCMGFAAFFLLMFLYKKKKETADNVMK